MVEKRKQFKLTEVIIKIPREELASMVAEDVYKKLDIIEMRLKRIERAIRW